MARRVPLSRADEVIQRLKEDGGVIVTGFSSEADVQRVNADARPYIDKVAQDVSTVRRDCLLNQDLIILSACFKVA